LQSDTEYNRFVINFKKSADSCNPRPTHRLIAKLNLPRIWTTNYDGILEKAYKDELMEYHIVADDKDIYALEYDKNQIIKMHGSLTDEKKTDIVLTESEYEKYLEKRNAIYHLLKNDVKSKVFIYLGFSFDDINLRRIISSAWDDSSKTAGKNSFLFIEEPKTKTKLYDYWKKDLDRYRIEVIELQDYSEIDVFLYELLKLRQGKQIVLIGKRDDDKYDGLAKEIGSKFAEAGYKLRSGGGPNLSIAMAEGIWAYLDLVKQDYSDKVQFLYRYGGGSTNPRKGQVFYCGNTYSDVRKKMISTNTICLLMGDESAGESGIHEEIDIANKKGTRIIPVGVSGDYSREIWNRNLSYFTGKGEFSEVEKEYRLINDDTASGTEIANAIVTLADYLLVRNYA